MRKKKILQITEKRRDQQRIIEYLVWAVNQNTENGEAKA